MKREEKLDIAFEVLDVAIDEYLDHDRCYNGMARGQALQFTLLIANRKM